MKITECSEEDGRAIRRVLAALPAFLCLFLVSWELREHVGAHPIPTSLVMMIAYLGAAITGCMTLGALVWAACRHELPGAIVAVVSLQPVLAGLNAAIRSAWMEDPDASTERLGLAAVLSAFSLAIVLIRKSVSATHPVV